jgi:hypothetical protein
MLDRLREKYSERYPQFFPMTDEDMVNRAAKAGITIARGPLILR